MQSPTAASNSKINREDPKFRLNLPMVKRSGADRNPWLAKMVFSIPFKNDCQPSHANPFGGGGGRAECAPPVSAPECTYCIGISNKVSV